MNEISIVCERERELYFEKQNRCRLPNSIESLCSKLVQRLDDEDSFY